MTAASLVIRFHPVFGIIRLTSPSTTIQGRVFHHARYHVLHTNPRFHLVYSHITYPVYRQAYPALSRHIDPSFRL